MLYEEKNQDLFMVSDDYFLMHCISADFCMGKGIAIEFVKRFDMKNKLQSKYFNFFPEYKRKGGIALIEGRVINLVTKEKFWQKPTYMTLRRALSDAKEKLPVNCKKIEMPMIGCGLDRLQWSQVSEIIKDIFADTDMELLICRKQ